MVTNISTRVYNAGKAVMALYATTMTTCITTMYAMAASSNATGNNASTGGFAPDTTFDSVKLVIGGVIASAISMLRSFIVPLATVACLCAILLMYLPGMSNKTTDKCKTVIWGCVATVVVAFALSGIFKLAEAIGGKL